ncbi:hypothetical protein EJ419_07970 [Alloscardovia theropitheci]|uniref:Uncharacterized protein n=1 Tax=Alloscardovia theropitheci TaxID=2496842 RepID=A0A4R0QUC4_9BIFI|nr:hypothetical protein [Alloscardovia theropitheci]TCD53567.1 hypothetical protein EJ419_07970 [Alloscardovia theropitheci]
MENLRFSMDSASQDSGISPEEVELQKRLLCEVYVPALISIRKRFQGELKDKIRQAAHDTRENIQADAQRMDVSIHGESSIAIRHYIDKHKDDVKKIPGGGL